MDGTTANAIEGDGLMPVTFNFTLVPAFEPEQLREQVRSSLARGLPEVSPCMAHENILSVAAGGPSLADTYRELKGYVGAVNGSLAWLLDRGVVPNACGICDPGPHMVDIIAAHRDVTYFVASLVHPSVFDKLIKAGCNIVLWHVSPMEGLAELLGNNRLQHGGRGMIGGGSTMGLRWLTLGYTCGFRKFRLHGLDSSFRMDPERGRASHAYPDHQDAKDWIELDGFQTKPNFIAQVIDFLGWMDRLTLPDCDPVEIKMYGEGLLQKKFRGWQAEHPGMHDGITKPDGIADKFAWPGIDAFGATAILTEVKHLPRFVGHVRSRGVAVQAGGNVGVYPAHLAQYFDHVHTFEPDPVNFACLEKNLATVKGNIAAYHAALGAKDGTCSTRMFSPNNVGAVRIEDDGPVPIVRIDDMDLNECDFIMLDVEGYELNALRGAEKTIERFRPAVVIEENDLPSMHGLPIGGARVWLEERGYKRTLKLDNDCLFLP